MLVRGGKGLVAFIGPLLILCVFFFRYHDQRFDGIRAEAGRLKDIALGAKKEPTYSWDEGFTLTAPIDHPPEYDEELSQTHRQVFSLTTRDREYFSIDFGEHGAINPNIIPHPYLNDTYIVVAQKATGKFKKTVFFSELVCNAVFKDGALKCLDRPVTLPIASTVSNKCPGDLGFLALNIGPHDARVFNGPRHPLTTYGSNSQFTCFSQFMQDFRVLVEWGWQTFLDEDFRFGNEIQRPDSYSVVEKNFFIFWDLHEQKYVHHDIAPRRVFSKLEQDGSVGPDLAPLAAATDDRCMAKFMPSVAGEHESLHQATNSLAITLCERSDPTCIPSPDNTFIMTIFHHKSFYDWHSVYEPYVMLFRQSAPFDLHAISTKPIWINGREKTDDGSHHAHPMVSAESKAEQHSEMFYITSMSWKKQGMMYHGYADDELFLAFGIEDADTAGIDILARDLLLDLGMCATVL